MIKIRLQILFKKEIWTPRLKDPLYIYNVERSDSQQYNFFNHCLADHKLIE